MKALHLVTWILLVIGGLNWLVFGLFGWDIGHLFGGMDTMISKIIYVLVGLSAVYEIFNHKNTCRMCNPGGATPAM
jgi:uncharacterized membrane protein YuzA (DUF378 family)